MNSDKILCPYCNKEINPGDQRCMQCGQSIPNVSLNLSDLTHAKEEMKQKNSASFILKLVLVITFLIIITVLFVWFFFLKR